MAASGVKPDTSCGAKSGSTRFYSTIISEVKDGSSVFNIEVGHIKAILGPKRNITTSFAICVLNVLTYNVSGKIGLLSQPKSEEFE